MNEEILKKLYESATSIFDMPSYEQFVKDMQDETKLNSFRQSMSQHYDMPEMDALKSDLGFVKKKEDTESAPLAGSLESLQINDDQLYAANKAALSAIGVPSSFGGFLSNALTRGMSRGAATDETLKVMYGGKDVTDEDLDKFIKVNQAADAMGQSEAMIEFNKGYEEDINEGSSEVWSFMKNLAKNPSVAPEVMITSLAQMASGALSSKEGFGVIAAGAGTGAGVGFGLGLAGGPLAPATSTIGAVTGSIKGAMSAAGGLTETTASFVEFLKEELKDKPFTQDNIRELLADEDAKQRIINRSLARGATIAAIDFLAAGASGSAAKGIKTVGRTGKVARGLATTGIEAVGGAGGEIGGRLVAGQELDTREILFEAVGEVPGAAVSGPLGLMSAPKYKVNKGALSKNDFLKIVNTATDEEILSMDIAIDNDEAMADIYNAKVNRAKTKKNIDPTITEQEDIDAVVDREIEIKELKKKDSYSAKNRVKELEAEIKQIQEKYKVASQEEVVATEPTAPVSPAPKVADVINRPVTLTELGGSPLDTPIQGDMFVEGQQVVVEDTSGNITEVGNVDEISNTPIDQLGIQYTEAQVTANSDGTLGIDNKNYTIQEDLPTQGLVFDKDGNVIEASVKDDTGKPVMFKGPIAEDIAYQILLKDITTPQQTETINQLLEQDDEFRKATEAAQVATDQNINEIEGPIQVIAEPVPGEEGTINAEVEKLSNIIRGPEVTSVIKNVKTALSKIAPNVKFVIHDNEESYAKATREESLADKSSGSYDPNTRTIHINSKKADARTVYHEAFHAIVLNYVKSNAEAKALTDRMIKAVIKAAPDNVRAELEAFAANYDVNVQSEEKLAEMFGILASEYKQLPTNTQSIVKRFLDKIAKALGLKPFTDSEVIDVLNSLAGKVSRGETIQQSELSAIVEKTSNYKYISEQNADTWADDMVRKQKRTKPDPVNTVKAYKLFRVKPNEPGKLFPLFVNADDFIEIGSWIDAEVGELTNEGKVKSKIGNLAYRPGWHMGDLPIATHIGDKYNFKKGTSDKSLKKPTARSADHVWAEVEVAADVDWQKVANERASKTKDGKVIPRTAHITDQIPEDGYYRYKTNPNMTGEWLISGSIKVTRALTDEEVIEINNAAGVADLPRVKPIDLKKLGFEVKADTEELSVRKRKIGNFEVSYFEDAKEFKELVDAGLVVNNYDINQLDGVKVAVHQPDNMFVGTLLHKGNQFFKGQGGVFYTPSTGNVWASGSENSANSLAKLINNSEVDGVRRMALVRGTDPKMLSSTEGVKAAMSIVELMVDDNLIPRKDFRSSLIRVGKKYNVDFSGSDSSSSIRKDIEDKFMKPTDSTFQKRGFFFEDLIDDLSKTSPKTKENSDKIREFLGFNKRKITFGKDGVKDAIGNLLTERLLVDLPNSHVYAIIETTSEVIVRPATKEEISNPEHGSYPFVLVTKDGSKPVLKLLSSRPHAVKDGVFRLKDGSEPSQAKLGLAQRGMGEAVVTARKQQSSPVYKIISKGKENGISDAAILKYLRDNGFDVNEGYDILDSINQQERKAKQRAEGLFDPEKNNASKFLDSVYKTLMSGKGYRPLSMQLFSEYKAGELEAEIQIARRNVKKIEKAIKGEKNPKAVIESIDKFMRGEKDHNVPESMMGIVTEMRNHLDNLSKKLVESGAVPSQESRDNIINNLGSYLNRSYEVYDNKNYAKKVSEETKQAAKNKLREIYREYAEAQSMESGVPVDVILNKKVDQVIEGILNQDEANEFVMKSKEGSKNLTPLEQRKDIPAEIRALMGEYGDPAMNYVRSIQKVAAIIANQTFQKQLRKSGEGVYLFTEPTGIYNVKIAGDTSESMDILAGMYTTKDIAEAMSKGGVINLDFGKFQPIYDFYLKSVGSVKYTKTILSLGTHAKNVLGNIPFMLMTGNFNLSAFNQAIQALRAEYSAKGKPELLAKMDEYTRLGIINQSATLGEIKDLLSSGKTFEDVMIDKFSESGYSRVKRKTKGFFKFTEKAYQVEDDFFKIAAYESEKAKYAKSVFKKSVNELTDSELKETNERAATVVKNLLPNYGRVGGYVKLLKGLPIAGTFISFTSESVRTSYNTFDLTFKEISDPKTRAIGIQRLAGIMSLVAVKAGLIAMWGLSADEGDEDELKNARKFLPFWDTNSTIAPTEIKDGQLKYRSISASDPHGYITKVFNAYINADNYNEGLTNALKEAYQPWLNPDMTFSVVSELISNRDKNGNTIFKEGDTTEEIALKITQRLWKIAEPGTITSALKIAKSENLGNEAIGQFTGFKEHKIDIVESIGYKSSDLQRRANESSSDYSRAKKLYDRGKISIQELSKQYEISNAKKKAVYQEAIDLYNGAIYLGANPAEVQQKMMDWGIPTYVLIGVLLGEIPDMKP